MTRSSSIGWPWWTAGAAIVLIAAASGDFFPTLIMLALVEAVAFFLIRRAFGEDARLRQGSGPGTRSFSDGHDGTTSGDVRTTAVETRTFQSVGPHAGTALGSVATARAARGSTGTHEVRRPVMTIAGAAPSPATPPAASGPLVDVAAGPRSGAADELTDVSQALRADSTDFSLPTAPNDVAAGHWIAPGQSVRVAGTTLPGGMVYAGRQLDAPAGGTEPSLINGSLRVSELGDCRTCEMGYWPSYTKASPRERRAYLTWLAGGRSDPACDIGYVFLFFYGLERRLLIDSSVDAAAKKDWPAITAELRRLLAIYGGASGSFRRYAGALLSWIEMDGVPGQIYTHPVPTFARSYELPLYVRVALGQAAIDGAPVPAALALAWVRLSPDIRLRVAATRCAAEFDCLFQHRYHESYGAGIVLRNNRTRLKSMYRAASGGLAGVSITMSLGDLPDVTAVAGPIKALRAVAEGCADDLAAYSRQIGKHPSLAHTIASVLLLPVAAWPEGAKTQLDALAARVREARVELTLSGLMDALGGTAQELPSRAVLIQLASALEQKHVGIEPDVLRGAKGPSSPDVKVVLFASDGPGAAGDVGPDYQAVRLTLQLGAALAQADGDFSEDEVARLHVAVDDWPTLADGERARLHAHVQLLASAPPTLGSLRPGLESLDASARESLAGFLVTVAQADGYVSPSEVHFLGNAYRALGLDPKRVFADVHAAVTAPVVDGSAPVATGAGLHLDADRIAALRRDTARVSALLSSIFTEEGTPAPSAPPLPEDASDETGPSLLFGLDESHAALARLLLSRPEWARNELEDAAADLGLMLDGALEQINDAALERFDAPLCEGDDPVEVSSDILEKLDA